MKALLKVEKILGIQPTYTFMEAYFTIRVNHNDFLGLHPVMVHLIKIIMIIHHYRNYEPL